MKSKSAQPNATQVHDQIGQARQFFFSILGRKSFQKLSNIGSTKQVISEPAAACLAYGLGQSDPEERFHVVVLRIGGRGMDASLVLVNHGLISVVETVSRDDFGGDTITGILADYLAAEFER